MLYLSRKVGESIIIDNNVELTVVEIKSKTAKLGFRFPPEVSILRKEIYDRIREENTAACSSIGSDFFEMDVLFDTLDEQEPSS